MTPPIPMVQSEPGLGVTPPAGDRINAAAWQRLSRLRWGDDPLRFRSQAALVREALRRAALWAAAAAWPVGWPPPTDFAALCPPRGQPVWPPCETSPALWSQLGLAAPPNPYVASLALGYLRLSGLPAPPWVADHGLPDPYEPWLTLFERGGLPVLDGGFVRVGIAGVVIRTWRLLVTAPALATDSTTLDTLDDLPT